MHRLTRLAIAAGCLAAASASAPAAVSAAPNTANVLLELRHSKGLHQFVRQVADPSSPRYREYRSPNALLKAYGADRSARRAATRFLADHGIEAEVGPSGTYVAGHATAEQLRAAFGGATARGAGGPGVDPRPSVPAELAGVVSAVSVGDGGPPMRTQATRRQAPANGSSARERTGTPAGCEDAKTTGGFTPNQYLTAYGHAALHEQGLTGKGQRIAVIEIDGFDPKDVETFAACFGHRLPPINAKPVGTKQLLPPGDETTLDLEVLSAAAPGLEAIDVYEGGSTTAGILQSVAAAMNGGKAKRPQVISISLGGCETNDSLDTGWVRALNDVFALAAGAGISVLVSSGDQGATPCAGINEVPIPALGVSFPASSQYVTAVGGTNIELDAANRLTGEVVWNEAPDGYWSAGGGGFSTIFGRPWWQSKAVKPSVNAGATRIVPDVAALADVEPGYAIYCTAAPCVQLVGGTAGWITVGGTSAAAPLTAAGVALANEAAAKADQPPVGFLNPLIYALGTGKKPGAVLSDVTVGDNDTGVLMPKPLGAGEPLGCCSAEKGFDAATGWGSLKMARLAKAALAAGRAR